MSVQGSHGLLSSVFFVSFLLSGCCNDGFFCCRSHLTAWGPSLTVVLVSESLSASENQIFFVGPILSWTNAVGDANFMDQNTYNGTDFANELSLLLPTWNTTANNNRTVTNSGMRTWLLLNCARIHLMIYRNLFHLITIPSWLLWTSTHR